MHSSDLKIVQFTDTHIFADPTRQMGRCNTRASFSATREAAVSAIRDSDLILVTGDLAAAAEIPAYRWLAEQLAEFETPVYCLPGNHDSSAVMAPIVSAAGWIYGGTHIVSDWHLVLLDSCVIGAEYGHLARTEIARLNHALAQHPESPSLICLHHHPVPIGSAWMDTMQLTNSAEFWAVVEQHPQVRGVLWGHVHQNFDTYLRGIRLLACPSTCVQFAARSTNFAIDPLAPGFRRLRLIADGTIDTEVIRVK